jgi:hypothetical protein
VKVKKVSYSVAPLPNWSEMACLQSAEPLVKSCYEAVMVYDEVFDEYVTRRASVGRAPAIERRLPEI